MAEHIKFVTNFKTWPQFVPSARRRPMVQVGRDRNHNTNKELERAATCVHFSLEMFREKTWQK